MGESGPKLPKDHTMATPIKTAQGNWRIIIEKHGVRKSKTCGTPEAASRWAALEVARITKQKAIAENGINSALGTSLPARVISAMAEVEHTHHDIAAVAMPIGSNCGIYFLLHEAVVVYVGQSKDLFYRIARHARDGEKVFDAFTYILCSEDELDKMEELYITAMVPRYNMRMGQRSRKKLGHPYAMGANTTNPA